MKNKIFKAGMAVSLCIAALATSCSDRIPEEAITPGAQVPLEVSVAGINKTRSVIEGTALPDTCQFDIFYKSPYPIRVTREEGKFNLSENVFLEENTPDTLVYAFYPANSYLTEIAVDTRTKEDYLRGISVDPNGKPVKVGFDNPKARIAFDHILARITVNIHKDVEIANTYKFDTFYLGGDNENSYRGAVFNAETNNFYYFFPDQTDNIPGERKGDKYWLETADDVITVDFLVLPTETTWQLNVRDLSSDWYSLPKTNYQPGKQYIYDCLIQEGEKAYLTITQCDIRPWENTTMPEVEGY